MSAKPLVSVVIVNWNGLEDTKECLASLEKQTYAEREVVVVDNGSEDGSKPYLKKQKGITYVDLDKNYGFTGGHIQGAKAAKGRYLAIINNDLVLDPDWLAQVVQTAQRHTDAAVVGGKLYKWNDQNPAYDETNDFYSWQEVDPKTGYTRTLLTGADECSVDSISGAALLIDTEALKKVGYFDDDFFAYYEETDLIARLLRAGYRAYYTPKALAWHKVAGSTEAGEESHFYLYMMHRNRYLFGVKNLDTRYLKYFQKNYSKEYWRALIGGLFRPNTERRARVDAYRWNVKRKAETLAKRATVQALGESYVQHLGAYHHDDITVIIPCYNYAKYVAEAIESVLAQTHLPKRIIILNDGSTDDSLAVIKKYADNELIEIIDKPNEGVIATKNRGLSMTETHWIVFFDADDIMKPVYLERLLDLARAERSDVVYTDMQVFGAGSADVFVAGGYGPARLVRRNFIHNSALIKTSLAKQVGGYKPIMKHGLEDWELYLSLTDINAKFSYVAEPIFLYRQHAQAMSRNAAVTEREKELYTLLLSLHPHLKPYANRFLTRGTTLVKGLVFFVLHPGAFLVLLRTIPRAIIAFLKTLVHALRHYKAQKADPDSRL